MTEKSRCDSNLSLHVENNDLEKYLLLISLQCLLLDFRCMDGVCYEHCYISF